MQCDGCYVNSIDDDGSLTELHHTEQSLEQTGLPSTRTTYNTNLKNRGAEEKINFKSTSNVNARTTLYRYCTVSVHVYRQYSSVILYVHVHFRNSRREINLRGGKSL
jgi:hypothetical protein